jgi:hypothetical protein
MGFQKNQIRNDSHIIPGGISYLLFATIYNNLRRRKSVKPLILNSTDLFREYFQCKEIIDR